MIKKYLLSLFMLLVSFFSPCCLIAEEELSEAEEAMAQEMATYDWKVDGEYKLSESSSTLVVPEGYIGLLGEDAYNYLMLTQHHCESNIEAIVFTKDIEETMVFYCYNDGYVSLDDWDSINSADLIKGIRENTENANVEIIKRGGDPLHVTGWVQEPYLDRDKNTVFWAIEGYAESDETPFINSIALRLGRKGYEMVNWITSKESYKPFGGELEIMLRSHSFDLGYGYSDFSHGDKLASYGIASLVAATVGGKIAKSAGLLIVLKKLWGVIFAGIAALFYRAKNWFKSSSSDK